MYVEKFEADSLDQALKAIKEKLGPDAIILKTKTNSGIKGAFSKSKIEITAAISETNYTKKAKVDHVMNDEQKETFYQAPSSHISQMIDNYSGNKNVNTNTSAGQNYGKIGLNKAVKNASQKLKNGLDDFLSSPTIQKTSQSDTKVSSPQQERPQIQRSVAPQTQVQQKVVTVTNEEEAKRIENLEQKVFELTKQLEKIDRNEAKGIYSLRTTLKSFDIDDTCIVKIIKKACFELNDSEQEDADIVFEYGLRELASYIQTEMPIFSNIENEPVVTVLVSQTQAGQSSMCYKLASLVDGAMIVRFGDKKEQFDLSSKIFDLKIENANSISEALSFIRRGTEDNRKIFVDFKTLNSNEEDTKRFISGLKRSFKNVEVLTCLSAIHTEMYNRNQLNKFHSVSDGTILTHIDLCLNFGAIFNLCAHSHSMPFKFFSTGRVIPDDIESASKERILNGLFRFDQR